MHWTLVSQHFFGDFFPYGTLLVNVIGSFAIGFLAAAFSHYISHAFISIVMIGVLGSFTTFSSFAIETFNLWIAKHNTLAGLNILLNIVLTLLAVTLGVWLAKGLGWYDWKNKNVE